MKILTNKYFMFSLRGFIALIFIFSGIEKIISPSEFSVSIINYKLTNLFISNIIAVYLPWLELISGILLLFGYGKKENLSIIMILILVFNLAVLIAIIRGLNIDCGCFGSGNGLQVGFLKLAENFGIFFLALYVFIFTDKSTNSLLD